MGCDYHNPTSHKVSKRMSEESKYTTTGCVKSRFNQGNLTSIGQKELDAMLVCMLTAKSTPTQEFQVVEQRIIDALQYLIERKERNRVFGLTTAITVLIGLPVAMQAIWKISELLCAK